MRKQTFLLLIITLAAALLIVAAIAVPSLAATQYRTQVQRALVTLNDQYNKNQDAIKDITSLPPDQQRSLAAQVLQPFQDAANTMPSLTPLGPLGWWNKSYTDALREQRDITQTIDKGAAYNEAVQQLMRFYQKSQAAVQNTAANNQTAEGLRQTATEYRTVASLRQQLVTSATLAGVNKDYIATLNSAADLFDQKASALEAGNTQKMTDLNTQFLQIGYRMSILASIDMPKDMDAWLSGAQNNISALTSEVQ